MRRMRGLVLVCVLVIGFSSLAFADENKSCGSNKDKMQCGMMGQGMMMHSMMMGKSLVATADGGVVVLFGNKLQKYDKDLILQKEVEIKMDTEGMQKTMMQMKEQCSKMSEKMKSETPAAGETKAGAKKSDVSKGVAVQGTQR